MDIPSGNSGKWVSKLGAAVNGKPLETASWLTSVITVPPGYHRLKNAVGLSVGLYAGRKLMDIAVGARTDGQEIKREEVPFPLRKLHGILSYNHFSDEPHDRWMKAVDNVAPAVFGAVGAMAGSQHFFKERGKALQNPTFMDDYEESMSMEQSKPWSALTGITSLFGSASGFSLGPFANYGASLGTRFNLGTGRKVALPFVGKLVSGNQSNYAFGPSQLLDRMIGYASENPSRHPERLEKMSNAILKSWFKDVTPEQIHAFADKVKSVRHGFLTEGGIPEEAQGKVRELLTQHFRKEGLEHTLQEIGLDPLKADLADNGLATTVSKLLGKAGKLNGMRQEFADKYTARHEGGAQR